MWQECSVLHIGPKESPPAVGEVWKTCLRQIVFSPPANSRGQIKGIKAYKFLLEIASGLHSPLIGETEVFGQFKAFKDSKNWSSNWKDLLEAVEEDVRKIRREFLKDIGSQSYGSLARRRLGDNRPIVLVGSGRLAQDLMPWIKERQVTILARNPKTAEWQKSAKVFSLSEPPPFEASHWIIAAPITNKDLCKLWEKTSLANVLDFRGEESFETCAKAEKYFSLKELFGELESIRNTLASKKAAALEAIEKRAKSREKVIIHRPYGWEDVFA